MACFFVGVLLNIIGENVRKFRTEQKMSQQQLSAKLETIAVVENIVSGENYELDFDPDKKCVFVFETECLSNSLAQYPVNLSVGGHHIISLSVSGSDTGKYIRQFKLSGKYHAFKMEFPESVKINKFFIG